MQTVTLDEQVTFKNLLAKIELFKGAHAQKQGECDALRSQLKVKRAQIECLRLECEIHEQELLCKEQICVDLCRTIAEADKAYQRIHGSTNTLINVLSTEMARIDG